MRFLATQGHYARHRRQLFFFAPHELVCVHLLQNDSLSWGGDSVRRAMQMGGAEFRPQRPHKPSLCSVHMQFQPWEGRERQVLGARWLAKLPTMGVQSQCENLPQKPRQTASWDDTCYQFSSWCTETQSCWVTWLFWRSEDPQKLFPTASILCSQQPSAHTLPLCHVHSTGLADFIKKVPESHGCWETMCTHTHTISLALCTQQGWQTSLRRFLRAMAAEKPCVCLTSSTMRIRVHISE